MLPFMCGMSSVFLVMFVYQFINFAEIKAFRVAFLFWEFLSIIKSSCRVLCKQSKRVTASDFTVFLWHDLSRIVFGRLNTKIHIYKHSFIKYQYDTLGC